MNELKINQENCYVDKRKLILDCSIGDDRYVFTLDDWEWDKTVRKLEKNGVERTSSHDGICNPEDWPAFTVIVSYKHCVQACFLAEEDRTVFIDRRYEHNSSYDVYYGGKHYLVGEEKY